MQFLQEIIDQFNKHPFIRPELMLGFSKVEIKDWEEKLGHKLPDAFVEYLRWTGHTHNHFFERYGYQWSQQPGRCRIFSQWCR